MTKLSTPKAMRLHIGIFGRTNVGKSSLLNAITRQNVAIVSEHAGTTTDPVEKPMEFLPLGPVVFIDTAGIDDISALGDLRFNKTQQVFDRTDIGVIVTDNAWGEFEAKLFQELKKRNIPIVIVLNKIDIAPFSSRISSCEVLTKQEKIVATSTKNNTGILDFRQALLDSAPEDFINNPAIVRDLVNKDDLIILVVPIDKEAPRGRLILPQVQTIRDLLDGDASCIVVKETGLKNTLAKLKTPPKLVVTDSAAFAKVAQDTPKNILLTSFSILFSRFKGDLLSQAIDTLTIDKLEPNDKILISEACSHHPITDDIGRIKIPKWLNKYVGGELDFHITQGLDFPQDLPSYKLVIHCGACMFNRRLMLNRIMECKNKGVPITNYGLVIAHCLKILDRALEPFPLVLKTYQNT